MGPQGIERGTAKIRLLDAAVEVIRAKGFSATSVEDLCNAAGVTKGAFFHHFDSKEALGVAAARHWSSITEQLFEKIEIPENATPVEQVLTYIDLRFSMIGDNPATYTCLAGTMVQETFQSHPRIRDACSDAILGHAMTLTDTIDASLTDTARQAGVTAATLALHIQVVLQGAFVVSKAANEPAVALDSITHLRRYLETVLE